MRSKLFKASLVTLLLVGLAAPVARAAVQEFPGYVKREVYLNIGGGNAVADLTGAPKYPNHPDLVTFEPSFDAPVNFAEAYGQRLSALLKVSETADYVFYISTGQIGHGVAAADIEINLPFDVTGKFL